MINGYLSVHSCVRLCVFFPEEITFASSALIYIYLFFRFEMAELTSDFHNIYAFLSMYFWLWYSVFTSLLIEHTHTHTRFMHIKHIDMFISFWYQSFTFQEDRENHTILLLINNFLNSFRRYWYACEWNFLLLFCVFLLHFIWMWWCWYWCWCVVCYLFLFNFFVSFSLHFGSLLHSSIHFSHILMLIVHVRCLFSAS